MKRKEIAIAVLPLENISDERTAEFYCKAFTMDLVSELSRFRQFQLIDAQTGKDGALLVDYSVQGSFRYVHDQFILNLKLVNETDRSIVWADRLEGSKDAIFNIQEELLKAIVSNLQQQLHLDLISNISKKPFVELRTYEFWLHGMEELRKGTLESDLAARRYF